MAYSFQGWGWVGGWVQGWVGGWCPLPSGAELSKGALGGGVCPVHARLLVMVAVVMPFNPGICPKLRAAVEHLCAHGACTVHCSPFPGWFGLI